MSPDQKAIVAETWRQVVPIADTAAVLFYDRLFELDPQLRVLFDGVDLGEQRKKLIKALGLVVGALDKIESLVPALQAMGGRHATYGVKNAHYETVGAALLWTLERGLGTAWTAEMKDAWTAAYGLVAEVMMAGAANDANSVPAAA